MATITALAPILFSAAKEVAAEPFGVVGAINTSFDDKAVARGDVVRVPIAPTRTASDFVAANVPAAGSNSTATSTDVVIQKSRKVDWELTGEQIRSLQNGAEDQEWVSQMIKQGMRTLRNEAEVDAALAVKIGASRAVGTAGTNPFATSLDTIVDVRQLLQDNGAPLADLQMVVNTTAGAGLRKLGIFQQAYQSGESTERRTGNFLPQFGFNMLESAGIGTHVKGTGASYTTTTAGFPVGTTQIPLITGTGTVVPGDIVTFAGDTNRYVVTAGIAAPGTITLGGTGLRVAIPAAATAMTVGNNFTANLAFERSAVVGVLRPPIMPANPAIQQQLVSDDKGMTYLMLEIAQYGMITWELHLAWGFRAVNGEFAAIVQG